MMRTANGYLNAIFGSYSQVASPKRSGRSRALRLIMWPLELLIAAEQRRREREALGDLDDRLLRDIGLTRAEVAAALANRRVRDQPSWSA